MEFTLPAKTRSVLGKKVKLLRNSGLIPINLYGKGIENQSLEADAKQFNKIFHDAGVSSLISLIIENQKPIKVLFKESSLFLAGFRPYDLHNYLSEHYLHV